MRNTLKTFISYTYQQAWRALQYCTAFLDTYTEVDELEDLEDNPGAVLALMQAQDIVNEITPDTLQVLQQELFIGNGKIMSSIYSAAERCDRIKQLTGVEHVFVKAVSADDLAEVQVILQQAFGLEATETKPEQQARQPWPPRLVVSNNTVPNP